jgi:CIC family chloride channel protein
MTSGYDLILPLMIANMSAYVLARRFRSATIYEALLAQDGVTVDDRRLADALDGVALRDLVTRDRAFVTFERRTRAEELLRVAREPSEQTVFPVLDDDRAVVGLITPAELRVLVEEPTLLSFTNAADVMRPATTVTMQDSLRRALERMQTEGIRELPVVDEKDRVVGFIDEGAVAHLYLASSSPPPSSQRELP